MIFHIKSGKSWNTEAARSWPVNRSKTGHIGCSGLWNIGGESLLDRFSVIPYSFPNHDLDERPNCQNNTMINFENAAPVKLKGAGGGLWVTLDPSQSEDILISELDKLFDNLKHLAVNASVVIDVGEAKGHEALIARVKSRLVEKYEVGRVSTSPQKRSVPVERIRQRDLSKGWNHHRSDVLMLRGRVRSGQKIDTRKHVVIWGDVNPGAEISSGGDIIVLGKLSGKVHAGCPDRSDAIVLALNFAPTQVSIGSVSTTGREDEAGPMPEFACVEDGGVRVKDYMQTNPFRKMPWPEAV